MSVAAANPEFVFDAEISTWFGVGGRADRLVVPRSIEELSAVLKLERSVRVLGDGANLLVRDDGVDGTVVDLAHLNHVLIDQMTGLVKVDAGVGLPKLITQTVRSGLSGLEVLAGIPATIGGAVFMNAGGKFGAIADAVSAVSYLDASGDHHRIERDQIPFSYRTSGFADKLIIEVEFLLQPDDPERVREKLKACMAYKKATQPLAADSAGCCFQNPVLSSSIEEIGEAGTRVSAGLLLDRAGCKGMREGGATVSGEHANFLIVESGGCADNVLTLMDRAATRVFDQFGVELQREVVVWGREASE